MKKFLLFFICVFLFLSGLHAQDYSLVMDSPSRDGQYQVRVTTILNKKQNKTAIDYLKRMTVDGVMFRGVAGAKGYTSQPPLISDPSVATLKADFFSAFNSNKEYDRYVNLNLQNVVVTKLPKGKFEVTGILTVNKEALMQYLISHDIVSSFDNLW